MESNDSIHHSHDSNTSQPDHEVSPLELSRRDILRGVGTAPTLLATSGSLAAVSATTLCPRSAHAEVLAPLSTIERRKSAAKIRKNAISSNKAQWKSAGSQPTNDDDSCFDRRASFSKTLPHNELGEVDPYAYDILRAALDSGSPDDFELIMLDPTAERRLANPQAALAYTITGLDPHFGRIAAPPSLYSLHTAAEMGEVYWAALTREIPFRHYSSDSTVGQALLDLNTFTQTVGPQVGGLVTTQTFLRGETPGDQIGPFVSQFLWKPVPFGPTTIEQRYSVPTATDFMIDFESWLAIQRGAQPTSNITYLDQPRYVYNGRSIGEYVHLDQSFQAYLFAALIGLSYGPAAQSPNNPYLNSSNQGGFSTHGGAEVLDLVTKVANLALRAAWFQKWSAHRRLRPEAYGGRLTLQIDGTKNYGLPDEICNSEAIAAVYSANGNGLLPQAYPEGSPTHPAYPAGHAAIAGACCTVLKAIFNEDFIIPDPVQASADGMSLDPWGGVDLTLGNEVNKLASNISLARDTAGVHYRSDGTEGLMLGEQVALAMLADDTRGYNEDFGGHELTTFDGTTVLIVDGEVYPL